MNLTIVQIQRPKLANIWQWLALIATLGALVMVEMTEAAPSLDGSLSLGLPQYSKEHQDPIHLIRQLLDEDCSSDFSLTHQALSQTSADLEAFVVKERLDPNKQQPVSVWLSNVGGGGSPSEPMIEKISSELDFIIASHWTQFKPIVQSIVMDKPSSVVDLAFRCERYAELETLTEFAKRSSLYRILLDVFASELLVHCIRRKLKSLKIRKIEPSEILRQFVDIYLDFPSHYMHLLAMNPDQLDSKQQKDLLELQASIGVQFDLQRSLAKHGSLDQAATLVFDTDSTLGFGFTSSSDSDKIVQRFKTDCEEYTRQLVDVWGRLDEFAHYMSTPMNNLVDFSNRIKFSSPPLMYAAVCSQLMQTA